VISAIFGPDLLIIVLFMLIPFCFLALSIVAIVDVASHSNVDFYAAGYSRTAWIVVIGVFTLFFGFGSLTAAYYLIAVRPKVRRIESAR
jgi:general stress protein CsbA